MDRAVQTRVVQWTFFAWLKLTSESSADCALTGRDALRLWGTYYDSRAAMPAHNDFCTAKSQFYVDIMKTYGAEDIVKRLAYDLADEGAQAYNREPINRYYDACISKLLYNIGDFPETSEHVVSYGLLSLLIKRVERYDTPSQVFTDYGNAIVVLRWECKAQHISASHDCLLV